jgi:hypothetical protein
MSLLVSSCLSVLSGYVAVAMCSYLLITCSSVRKSFNSKFKFQVPSFTAPDSVATTSPCDRLQAKRSSCTQSSAVMETLHRAIVLLTVSVLSRSVVDSVPPEGWTTCGGAASGCVRVRTTPYSLHAASCCSPCMHSPRLTCSR